MSAQNLDHRGQKNRRVLIPRPGWSYRGARRNAMRDNGWLMFTYMPPDSVRRRRLTGNRP